MTPRSRKQQHTRCRRPLLGFRHVLIIFICCSFSQTLLAQPATQLHGNLLHGEPFVFDLAQPHTTGSASEEAATTNARGRHSLLIFWASWCPTCMREIPHLKQLHSRYASRVNFIGINVNKQVADGLRIEQQRELPYPSISDPELEIADRFGVRGTPTMILFGTDGREVARSYRLDSEFLDRLDSVAH